MHSLQFCATPHPPSPQLKLFRQQEPLFSKSSRNICKIVEQAQTLELGELKQQAIRYLNPSLLWQSCRQCKDITLAPNACVWVLLVKPGSTEHVLTILTRLHDTVPKLPDNILWQQKESYGVKVCTIKSTPEQSSTFSITLVSADEEKNSLCTLYKISQSTTLSAKFDIFLLFSSAFGQK